MRGLILAVCFFFGAGLGSVSAEDMEGCTDYPLVSRMPKFSIAECETKTFDAVEFKLGLNAETEEDNVKSVEGKRTYLRYTLDDGAPETSALQIFRNYQNAFKKLGAKVYERWDPSSSYNYLTAVVTKDNRETWLMVDVGETEYELNIIEAGEMAQEVTTGDMLDALNTSGSIALSINFDTGAATIKDDSVGIVEQLHQLLADNPELKVSVEGHTDDTGTPAGNKQLSEDRARAVVDALTAKGIDADRLAAVGWGQEKPVADNQSEEGRARNRRVEIIKK